MDSTNFKPGSRPQEPAPPESPISRPSPKLKTSSTVTKKRGVKLRSGMDPETRRLYDKAWREKNKLKIRKYQKAYRAKRRLDPKARARECAAQLRYYYKNKKNPQWAKKRAEFRKAWIAKKDLLEWRNIAKIWNKRYRDNNKEKCSARAKDWYNRNKERAIRSTNNARKRRLPLTGLYSLIKKVGRGETDPRTLIEEYRKALILLDGRDHKG